MEEGIGKVLRDNPELIKQILAKRRLLGFAKYMNPNYIVKRFHESYARILDYFAQGKVKNLIIQAAPQHGKSEMSSRMLPAFMLGLNPELKIVIASYAATIAKDFNRDVQRLIDSEAYHKIFPDTVLNDSNIVTVADNYLRNSDVFEIVGHRGSLRVVGRGGALTSKTADILIMDDLYKDGQEANSPLIRESAWDWYTKVARSRLHNDSQQLIVFTRWHPEDIIGRIIESEQVIVAKRWEDFDNIPENAWVLVNFEAIKTTAPNEIDPREVGEALWPERHSLERLEAQRALDPVGFDCLYQGSPETAEGRLYQPFKEYSDKSEWGTYIRSGCYIDVADEGDDFLSAISYDIYKSSEQFFNEKKQRFEPLLFALVTDIEYTDLPTDVTSVTVPRLINANRVQRAWVESNSGGSQFEKTIKKKIRALTMPFYQGANKESRIVTNAPFVNQHIIMPIGWETRYPKFYKAVTEFLRVFSANKHDDACLVAGTKIKTIFGDKPIEQIKKGDLVITPYGLNRVLDARCTGEKQVITKCGLRGTPNHKVFNKNSFDSLAGIYENNISLYGLKSNLLWKYRILLYSMDKPSVLWGREGIILANQIQIKGERVLLDFMLRFGSFIIKGKFRKAIMFTIKTVTSLTMTLIIWNVYHVGNTYKNIIEKIRRIPNLLKREKRIWQKGWRQQSNGTQAKKGENGIVSIQKPLIEHQDTKIPVSSVEKPLNHISQKQISVQTFAEKNTEVESCNTRESVKIAERNLNTEKQNQAIKTENFVQEDVQQHIQTKTGIEKVYNLTVEKANCYYANGILVSNCDCLTGIYEKEIADGNTKPYGASHRGIKVH